MKYALSVSSVLFAVAVIGAACGGSTFSSGGSIDASTDGSGGDAGTSSSSSSGSSTSSSGSGSGGASSSTSGSSSSGGGTSTREEGAHRAVPAGAAPEAVHRAAARRAAAAPAGPEGADAMPRAELDAFAAQELASIRTTIRTTAVRATPSALTGRTATEGASRFRARTVAHVRPAAPAAASHAARPGNCAVRRRAPCPACIRCASRRPRRSPRARRDVRLSA